MSTEEIKPKRVGAETPVVVRGLRRPVRTAEPVVIEEAPVLDETPPPDDETKTDTAPVGEGVADATPDETATDPVDEDETPEA